MVFKKGDPSLAENHRPICLTVVAYRIHAWLLKQRLLDGGLDDRLWSSQFGFRKRRSTEDAIYVIRRRIELAHAQRNGQLHLLALDWKRAFDSVNISSLVALLHRFGIPAKFVQASESLMLESNFYVEDGEKTSTLRRQLSGITQGCTLSPLLFITLMTALMQDAISSLSPEARNAYERSDLADLAYADDTLLFGVSARHVQELLHRVASGAQHYGLELHSDKFQLIQVRCGGQIHVNDRSIDPAPSMTYLGSTLTCDGRADAELSRRIGIVKGDFRALCRVWRNSSLTVQRKLHIYCALVEAKLHYGLSAIILTKAQRRKLDGFQCRCLRSILKIPAAFYSRVSNLEVLQKAGVDSSSAKILKRPLLLLGRVCRAPLTNPLRSVSFVASTLEPLTNFYIRRVGGPRTEWVPTILKGATRLTGGGSDFDTAVTDETNWRRMVHCTNC